MTVEEAQVISLQIAQSSLYVAILQTIVAILTLVASVAVSVILYLGTRRIAIAEYRRSMRDGWASVNSTALGDENTLKIADLLLEPSLDTIPDEVRRRKWFSYMLLNPLATTYYGIQNGYVEPGTLARVKRMVSVLMKHDEVYELTQRDIFEPEFATLCTSLRGKPCNQQPDATTTEEQKEEFGQREANGPASSLTLFERLKMSVEKQMASERRLFSTSGNGTGVGVALGAAIGAAYGASSGNMGQSLALCVAFGTAIGAIFDFANRGKSTSKKPVE